MDTIATITVGLIFTILAIGGCAAPSRLDASQPYLVVLGIGQDAGIPQAGNHAHRGWTDPAHRRLITCLGLVDPTSGGHWMFEATPDFRQQLYDLHVAAGRPPDQLSGIFLTHAHIGHYTGLMFVGHESMGAKNLPVYAMPQMQQFLTDNGPWSQLVRFDNIAFPPMSADVPVALPNGLRVTPFLVPHRQEFSEVVGYRIEGPNRAALFIPDIDAWEDWDAEGTRIEDALATVDVAFVDATFFANGEIPGRDMSGFPHPFIVHTMDRLAPLPAKERAKVRFIHLNHTNPALDAGSDARAQIRDAGMSVAEEGERFGL